MSEYTLTYSPQDKGWPSFYSFIPESMVGLNNYFYSFKNGQLYRHNTNENRANFYNVQYDSTVTSVFNQSPLQNKLFKTLEIQSDTKWKANLETDLLDSQGVVQKALIENNYFETKEGNQFAFIRYVSNDVDFLIRYANGIASCTTVTNIGGNLYEIAFGVGVQIDSILSVGDTIFSPGVAPSGVKASGTVTAVNRSTNIITIEAVLPILPPLNGEFIMYVKNTVAESHGVRGHYMKYTLTSQDRFPSELFSVVSDAMMSHPTLRKN
ncbi:MAG: putative structural protein [Prokaryotic dsDNA virus sp.]|nr:MAG: putative structural protein [Prokaryotic dsDNA virus sp.]|tara:strand:- start:3545 stop:4345 length:801 start_codon:yes stop_codon:yes gene_type:complete